MSHAIEASTGAPDFSHTGEQDQCRKNKIPIDLIRGTKMSDPILNGELPRFQIRCKEVVYSVCHGVIFFTIVAKIIALRE